MDDDYLKNFTIVIAIVMLLVFGIYNSIDNKKRAFEKGATISCSYNHGNDAAFLSKRKGAILLNDITTIIQDKKKYNLFFCDLVDDDKLKKIRKEFLNELLNK